MKTQVSRIFLVLLSAILLLGAVSCGVEPPSGEATAAGDSSTVEQTEAETEIPAPDIKRRTMTAISISCTATGSTIPITISPRRI